MRDNGHLLSCLMDVRLMHGEDTELADTLLSGWLFSQHGFNDTNSKLSSQMVENRTSCGEQVSKVHGLLPASLLPPSSQAAAAAQPQPQPQPPQSFQDVLRPWVSGADLPAPGQPPPVLLRPGDLQPSGLGGPPSLSARPDRQALGQTWMIYGLNGIGDCMLRRFLGALFYDYRPFDCPLCATMAGCKAVVSRAIS
jgi:hypothetical protein